LIASRLSGTNSSRGSIAASGLAERPEIKNLLKIVVANTAGDEHSEERFVRFLLSKELERRWVGGASERQFCPDRCEPILRETVAVLPEPKPRLVYGVSYGRAMTVGGETKSSTAVNADAGMLLDALIQAAAHRPEMVELKKAHQSRKADASRLFQQPEPPAASTGGCKPASAGAQPEGALFMSQLSPVSQASSCDAAPGHACGALTEQLSRPDAAALGGIDFSSLELRYLADANEGAGSGLRYAFRAQSGAGPGDRDAGLQAAREASDAFFVWLALPPRRLWVNLGPNEPDRIIDADLGRTDAGRILLEADLALKKTTATDQSGYAAGSEVLGGCRAR
jgi:hypothetical protein